VFSDHSELISAPREAAGVRAADARPTGTNWTPNHWRWAWRRLAHYGYVHVTYGTYLTADGRISEIANWDVAVPARLRRISRTWGYSPWNPEFRSGVIQFERADGLLLPGQVSRGLLTSQVLTALRGPVPYDPYPFQWVEVNKSRHPEELGIWRDQYVPHQQFSYNGKWIFHTVVNTGVLHSTPDGTWPIYQRLRRTTMVGTYPVTVSLRRFRKLPSKDRAILAGRYIFWQHYVAPNVQFVNYFYNGRAIHFYPRKGYGWPQSAGCVEEPFADARQVYKLLNYGDLVSVIGRYRVERARQKRPLDMSRRMLVSIIKKQIQSIA